MFAVIDIETTGLHPHLGDDIFMIGILKFNSIEDSISVIQKYRMHVDILTGKQYSVVQKQIVKKNYQYAKKLPDSKMLVNAVHPKIWGPIIELFDNKDCVLICHNSLFDLNFIANAMKKTCDAFNQKNKRIKYWAENIHELWDQDRVWDTMVVNHYLQNNAPHGLKELGVWLFAKGNQEEQQLLEEVKKCKKCISPLFEYLSVVNRLSEEQSKELMNVLKKHSYYLPQTIRSIKNDLYKSRNYDFIPARLMTFLDIKTPYIDQISKYFNFSVNDALVEKYLDNDLMLTYMVFMSQYEVIKDRFDDIEKGLKIIKWKNRCLGSIARIQNHGVTMNMQAWKELFNTYTANKEKAADKIFEISEKFLGKKINPNSGKQLIELFKNVDPNIGFQITEKGNESVNAQFLIKKREWLYLKQNRTEREEVVYNLINNILAYRKNEKMLEYLIEYDNLSYQHDEFPEFKIIYTKYNPVGTMTTRLSSSEPNLQNIGRGELRKAFGPVPGKLWFSIDYTNIELRIFAYASGSGDLIKAFEEKRNVHCIIGRLIWDKEWKICEDVVDRIGETDEIKRDNLISAEFKSRFPELYQKVKNGNFSIIYGAGENKADITYGKEGAYRMVMNKLTKVQEFLSRVGKQANEYGYVILLPTVLDYRLHVGNKEHVAVNYFIQGSAGNVLSIATRYVHDYFNKEHRDCAIIMTIHDELVIEVPQEKEWVVDEVVKRMTSKDHTGKWFNFPLEVGVERHDKFWK